MKSGLVIIALVAAIASIFLANAIYCVAHAGPNFGMDLPTTPLGKLLLPKLQTAKWKSHRNAHRWWFTSGNVEVGPGGFVACGKYSSLQRHLSEQELDTVRRWYEARARAADKAHPDTTLSDALKALRFEE